MTSPGSSTDLDVPPASSARIWRLAPELVSAVSGAASGLLMAGGAWSKGFPLDDAWIHLVYGLSLYEGGGFAYNAGEPGAGATSPLWAIVAAFAHLVVGGGPSTYAASCLKVLSLASHALAAGLAAYVARLAAGESALGRIASLVAGLVVATCPALAFASVSGMEVSLTAALLLATLAAAANKRPLVTALFAGLAVCARPEAFVALPFVALLAARGLAPLVTLRRCAMVAGGALVLPGMWIVRNVTMTGRALPSTVYAKAALKRGVTLETVRTAFITMLGEVRPMGTVIVWLLVLVAIILGGWSVRRVWKGRAGDGDVLVATAALIGLSWVFGLCIHTYFYTPKWFYYLRYLLPVLPLFLVCGVVTVARIARVLSTRVARPWLSSALVASVGFAAVTWEVADFSAKREAYAHDVESIDSVQVALGRYLGKTFPASAVVWSVDAGAIRYFGRQRIVDLVKLNTPELLRDHEVPPSWEPNAVVLVIPYAYRASFDQGPLPIVQEAPTDWRSRPVPADWPGPMPTQIVLVCPPGRTVDVKLAGQLVVHGRCAGEPQGG